MLQCVISCQEKNETKDLLIQLENNNKEKYPLCLQFQNNLISVCEEKENTIKFIYDLIENPAEFIFYQIHFQNKEYLIIAEVVFTIIINEFKQQIEKNFIIENTHIQIPIPNRLFKTRRIIE